MNIFKDEKEIINHAVKFIEERTESLKKDVEHCLRKPYAPFPALLYCFSTIELLGALHGGNAAKSGNQPQKYLKNFMHYTKEQMDLLMKIFRHKIVHLAQPSPVIKYNNNYISWHYYHEKHENHLKLVKHNHRVKFLFTKSKYIEYTHEFNISIAGLMEDILKSVNKPQEGYLAQLKNNVGLQKNFKEAYTAIYKDALSQS
ncbi:MAG: hypothetical protein AAB065_03000 [Deltaproteobacteria bacterium]